MAWIDDRAWCHPKLVDLTDRAFRAYVCGITYSSGFGTKGALSPAQQAIVGATARTISELVQAGLWEPLEDGCVAIHDWDDHNAKRDLRRERERDRKRDARAEGRWNETDRNGARPNSAPDDAPDRAPARGDGSDGSDLKPEGLLPSRRRRKANSPSMKHDDNQTPESEVTR
jgi:hypothetical protein